MMIPDIPNSAVELKYDDWFINVKNPPKENTAEYETFWSLQELICKKGCVTGGVFFNPYLYWHLNFWGTEVDYLDEDGKPQQIYKQPNLRDNEWVVFNAIWEAEKQQKGLAIGGIRRAGKDLLNSSKIWTENGPKEIGNALVGDRIYDRSGNLTTIIEVAPQGVRPVYKMKLQDGRELFCGLDHNWIVEHKRQETVLTTRDLLELMGDGEYFIPKSKSVNYPDNDCFLPFVDGELLHKFLTINPRDHHEIREEVMYGSTDTRKAFLDGLSLESISLSRDISEYPFFSQIKDLYNSLGFDVTIDKTICKTLKTDRYIFKINERTASKIVAIEYVFDAETTCIMVDNDGHDFLTDHYTVTHNSVFESSYMGHGLTFDQDSQNVIAGLNSPDIKLITDKIEKGLNNLPEYFRWMKVEGKWDKAVSFGVKDKTNQNFVFSQILIRNLDDGNNEEAIAGTKPRKLMIDEALHEDELVYKEDCAITMKQVKVGDFIYDESMKLTKVVEKIDPGIVSVYTMNLENGLRIKSSDNHIWSLRNDDGDVLERTTYYIRECVRKGEVIEIPVIKEFSQDSEIEYVRVESVEYFGEHQCYCIRVDNKSKLFLTTNFIVTHNCAKGPFLKGLHAAKPGFTTPYGWTCSPIMTFTGGDAKKFSDAKKLMMNPLSNNFLSFPHKDKPGVYHGLFLDMKYRLEGKVDSNMADYLNLPKNKELRKIKMQVSDEEKSRKVTTESLELLRVEGDQDGYNKERMYYPENVEDIFLTTSTNLFNKDAIKRQIQLIEDRKLRGSYVELYHDGFQIKTKPSNKFPVPEYPTPKGCDTDAPVVIYEPPITDSKFALYVAGVDTYHKDGTTEHSDSLGTVYVYKRIHNITGDGYQDTLVASYAARPEDKRYWQEQARFLIKYYNAYTLVENNEITFIDYMKQKNDAIKYLAPQPGWLKTVTPNSTQNQAFGVSRTADKVQSFLEEITSNYIDEVVHTEKDSEGSVINEVLGVSRIFDKPLLQELLEYERGKNADRYVAFSLALAQARDLNPTMNPQKETNKVSMAQVMREKGKSSSLRYKPKNSFIKKRRK